MGIKEMGDKALMRRFEEMLENLMTTEDWSDVLHEVRDELEGRGYEVGFGVEVEIYKESDKAPLLDGDARKEVVAKAVSAYIGNEAGPVEDGNDLAPILRGYLDNVCFHLFEEPPLEAVATLIVLRHRETLKKAVGKGEREALVAEIIGNGG